VTIPATTPPPAEAGSKPTDCDPRALSFELLHALSQPLTALRCSLELALQQNPTPEKCREILNRSLAQAERASWLTMAIRELFDAGRPGENCEVLDLRGELVRAIGDIAMVADASGVKIIWLAGKAGFGEVRSSEIWFDELRLHRALFNLL
jgi:signal transduction histidine kinase